MNIIEAVKSQRPFRRVAWETSDWITPNAVSYLPRLRSVDIVADDWEVEKSQPVTITREQFYEAWEKSRTKNILGMELVNSYPESDALAKELGL